MIESLVGFELIRRHEDSVWEGLNQLRRVYMWRDSRGGEVDFLVWDREKLAIEVKWQRELSERDAQPLRKTFGKGILLSKDLFATWGSVEVMPVWWFLFFLGEE